MSNIVISVEHLSKAYRLGQIGTGTLTNDLKVWWAKKLGRPNPMLKIGETDHGNRDGETLWALRDLNFQVEQGEVLGIIGRNGAGKSTLLKILACVTAPTSGCVRVKGRVASLLEVGTGFHPDLTGRENIYLNGSILGMTREEVRSKFDEIVAFAEIEQFIDTPVKRYSSGMYVRLAFAVAAHLEADILLIDEVLAVGDFTFQKKCLEKMGGLANEGRTIFFVSHNLSSIQALCQRGILVEKGQIMKENSARAVVEYYSTRNVGLSEFIKVENLPRLSGGNNIKLVGIDLYSADYEKKSTFEYGDSLILSFSIRIIDLKRSFAIEWFICSVTGQKVLYGSSSPQHSLLVLPKNDLIIVECIIPSLSLASGQYLINCMLSIPHQERLDEVEGASKFEVTQCDPWNTGFNLNSGIALTTAENRWKIVSGGTEFH